ncbi:MAG TPA: PAS domain S-box protein [Xanthomonadaceae bacterium]|jgi:PAS domain S-box-containing protein|nr:PAS domain S-box protein [Xanthomonadaceae bacterium]
MAGNESEEEQLRSVALQNARSILKARQRAEEELLEAKETLESRSVELASSLAMMRATLEATSDGIMVTDRERRVTNYNRQYADMWGLSNDLLHGPGVLHPAEICVRQVKDPARYLARIDAIYSSAPPESFDVLEIVDGRVFERMSRIQFLEGCNVGRVWSYRDISDRKRADESLIVLAAIVESSDDAIVSKDLNGIIRSWNRGAERLFGYTSDEAVGRSITLIIPPDLIEEEQKILQQLRRGERIEHFETLRMTKAGRRLDISLTISPIRDHENRIIGVSKIARDITELKRAQEALARDALLLANVRDAIVVADLEGIVTHWNAGAQRLFGWTSDEALGRHYSDRIPAPARAQVTEDIRLHATGMEWSGEYEAWRKDGSRVWIDARIGALADARGRMTGILGLANDITERRQAEEALRVADRRKDEFLALLAHELRNPLAPLRNGLQVMRLAAGDADAVAKVRAMMDRQLSHMVRLVDDLLDLSRIGQNKMELRRALVPLKDVIDSAVETARPAIEAADHQLTVILPAGDALLDADLTRLAQVFSNLLTNSAKYTEQGGHIWLTGERCEDEVVVTVTDTGIGIPAEALPNVFDMFSQVDRSNERATGGLGIGLALVKGFVEMHGGSVTAESEGRGKGSQFEVRLPTATAAIDPVRPARRESEAAHVSGRRILVVDDNEDAARSMARVLTLQGDEALAVHDGFGAIDVVETFRPHVILMDVGMPRMNGYEVSRRIRECPWGRTAVIIAVTGWGQDVDRVESREAGCDGHLVKPVDLQELARLMEVLISARSTRLPAVQA